MAGTTTTTTTMHHAKSDSEVTSFDQSTPPRSLRRPLYYVQSPSNHDAAEKMSFGSSPAGSPGHHHHHSHSHSHSHHYYHCSPIHHSRESSATRFSASLKNPRSQLSAWRKIASHRPGGGPDSGSESDSDSGGLR